MQDFLNDSINVSVGNVNKINPAFLIEEKLDYLILGDVIEGDKIPSSNLYNWMVHFSELCKKKGVVLKSISSYCVSSGNFDVVSSWIKIFQEFNLSIVIFPPVLQLNLEKGGLSLEKNVFKSVKDYSNDFIDFFIKSKKGVI